jgi:RNA polymerase sigma factor (sigma-70 family)
MRTGTSVVGTVGASPRDDILVARCLAGDDGAWRDLLGHYAASVEAVIRRYRLPADEQADVCQEVWLSLWRNLPHIRQRGSVRFWLAIVAGRLALDARDRLGHQAPHSDLADLPTRLRDDAVDVEEQAIQRETGRRTRVALARISPRCGSLLRMLYLDGQASYADVAARLGCAPNSIGPIRRRCFDELRTALAHLERPACPRPLEIGAHIELRGDAG